MNMPAKRPARLLGSCLALTLAACSASSRPQLTWTDDTFEELSRGTLDAGGQNLYVSRDGKVRTIHRFDLNDDGYLDLIFNCTHDTYQLLPATAGSTGRDRAARSADIAVAGSQQVALADLDKDGHTDAVFCPNSSGVDTSRRLISIAWGGADGWAAGRVSGALPLDGAAEVAIADLNADGWPDLVGLGASRWLPEQPEGRILRVFWGSPGGFSPTRFQDLGEPNALAVAAGDFDGDGVRDLAILRSDGRVAVIWADQAAGPPRSLRRTEIRVPGAAATCLTAGDTDGDGLTDLTVGGSTPELFLLRSRPGRNWEPASRVTAFPASNIAVGDLDRDGKPDLVLTHFSERHAAGGEKAGAGRDAEGQVRVLWGPAFGVRGATALPAHAAAAAAIGDLDADGNPDLVVAQHQGEKTFAGSSGIFYGDGRRGFVPGASGFRTSGATHVAVAPPEGALPARAVFCNSIGGMLGEAVPILLYWGGANGFDRNRVWRIPFHSGYEASAADLNADGYADLVALNSGHAGESARSDATLGANIFWGGPRGFDLTTRRTVLHEQFLGTSGIADLDRDGYLDLVLEPFAPEKPGETDQISIYYGGRDGYAAARRVKLPSAGYAQEHLIADFNNDGWLDIGVATRGLECVRIFWGGPGGFDPRRERRLNVADPIGVDAADFNGDGWLDVLTGSYSDPRSGHKDMGVTIFWGSPAGYRTQVAQWLPGFTPLGRTIADFDGDGYLDLFAPQQTGELTRDDLACYLYWGGPDGFSTRRRTTLFCDSVNDSFAGDFDHDGKIDVAVSCHTRNGDHRANSMVFYNDGHRFANPRVQTLPTTGPHLIWAQDLGHILSRKNEQAYTSAIFRWNHPASAGRLTPRAETPRGTRLALAIRSAVTTEALTGQAWKPVTGGRFDVREEDRCLQYRAIFHSDNGDRYPVLDRMDVSLR